MSCSSQHLSPSRKVVSVNGRVIAREAQHHPADKPAASWGEAAAALVIRELLLQEAERLAILPESLSDGQGRRETDEEARIRALVEQAAKVPSPDETAELFDEDVAEYAFGAIRRYSNAAGNEEWLSLMTALGASGDPGRTCLVRILDWALLRDAAELRRESSQNS